MFDHRLMEMCPAGRKYIIRNVILQWLELCLNAAMIAVIALLAEGIVYPDRQKVTLTTAVLVVLATLVLRFFVTRAAVRMSYLASRSVKKTMRQTIYQKLLQMGASYREHVSTAELIQESTEGVEQLESYFGQYVPQFFYAFLAPLTLFVLFGLAGSFKVGLLLLICVPLIPGAIMMVQKIAKKILAKYWDQYTKLGSTFLENLQGMTTLKTYQADAFKNEQMNRESEHFRVITMKVLTMQLNSIIIMDFFAYGGAAIGIIAACKAYHAGTISLAAVIFMILLSAEFFLPMRKLGSYFHVAMNGMAASDKIFRFLSTETGEEKLQHVTGEDIVFDHVTFSYDGKRDVLKDVSLAVPKGSFVGIVGESGSGKSTLASLLMARNTASSGKVLLGGTDISKISERELMDTLSYTGIDAVFFKGTVRENLLLVKEDAGDEELLKVLEECALKEEFEAMQGLDTELRENASNLSGGQRQRLAVARSLLHDAPVFIFDEATSNIDMESEEILLKRILALRGKKTVIFITHRLANVKTAEKIFCFEDGKLAESGDHETLLEENGVYARLWKTQSELENYGKEASL